jgi:hypothetical protein
MAALGSPCLLTRRNQCPFQEPKLEVPTIYIYKAYIRPMCGDIPTKYGLIWYRILKFPLINGSSHQPPNFEMINGWDETLTGPFRPRVGFDYCIICSGCNFGPFKCTDPEGDQGERFGIQKMVISSSPTIAQDARVSAQLGTCLINHPVCRSTTIGGRTIHNRVYILSPLPPKFQSYWCLQSKAANERNKSNP